MPRQWRTAIPSRYAAEKEPRLLKRYDGALGDALRRMVPVAWPGVPVSAVVGFTASASSARDNTTDTSPSQRFHELGYFQIEGGLRDKPAPDPDPRAEYSAWAALASSPLVVELLGHPASVEPLAWRPTGKPGDEARDLAAIEMQAAVGLANLRRHFDSIRAKLPASLVPLDVGGVAAFALAMTAFSRGSSGAWRALRPVAGPLAAVPEAERVQAWGALLLASEDPVARDDGRDGAAWAWMRTAQKIESGRRVEEKRGGAALAWYGPACDASAEERLTRRAYGA